MTNEKGEVVWLANYEAWGNISEICKDFHYQEQEVGNVKISSEDLQPIRFQGQYLDQETGLHYNRFRYYDPDLGMFISRDPIGLMGGNNVFQYAPNPIGWIDPFGLVKHTYYQLKDGQGNVVYHGITERPIQERLSEHNRDGKSFSQVSYVDNLDSRVDARNLEGSALYHDRKTTLQKYFTPS